MNNVPDEIIIEITKECNLECSFCFNKQHKGSHKDGDMPYAEVLNILKQASQSHICSVRFTGGEPLLHKDISKILQDAKGMGFYVIMNTNGVLLDRVDLSILENVDLILLSMHEKGTFERIRRSLDLIDGHDVSIMIATIITEDNILAIESYYDFIRNISEEYSGFVEWFLLRPIPNINSHEPISLDYVGKIANIIKEYNNRYGMHIKIANSLPFCAAESIAGICKGGIFDSGHTRLLIDSDGNYRADYFSPVLSSVDDKSIIDVWNSQALKDIRRYQHLPDYCKRCFHLNTCKGGLSHSEYLRNPSEVANLASVIIPVFNDSKRMLLALRSLERQSISNFEVIVVDDGSTDDTKQKFESFKSKTSLDVSYHYLPNSEIFGAAQARNHGAKKAKGEVLLFLDQDVVAHHDLVKNHLQEHAVNDIVLGYYSGYGNDASFHSMKELEAYADASGAAPVLIPEFRDRFFSPIYGRDKNIGYLWKYFVSANLSIKRSIFNEYMFEESFRSWGCEDIELGFRLCSGGYRISFSRRCIAYESSDVTMITEHKFASLMDSLKLFFSLHPSDEIRLYLLERFYHTPVNQRLGLKIMHDGPLCKSTRTESSQSPAGIFIDGSGVAKIRILEDSHSAFDALRSEVENIIGLAHKAYFDISSLESTRIDLISDFSGIIRFLRDSGIKVDTDSIRVASAKAGIRTVGPEELSIDINDRCNINCIFCAINSPLFSERKVVDGRLSLSEVTALIDEAYSLGAERIRIYSGGEPTVSSDFAAIIDHIAGKGMSLSLLTDGTTIDNRLLNILRRIEDAELLINLSAASAKSYSEIACRGEELFSRVLDNLRRLSLLKRIKAREGTSLRIGVTYIITGLNFREIGSYPKLFSGMGIDRIYFKFAALCHGLENLILRNEDIKEMKTSIKEAQAEAMSFGIFTNIDEILSNIEDKGSIISNDTKLSAAFNTIVEEGKDNDMRKGNWSKSSYCCNLGNKLRIENYIGPMRDHQ